MDCYKTVLGARSVPERSAARTVADCWISSSTSTAALHSAASTGIFFLGNGTGPSWRSLWLAAADPATPADHNHAGFSLGSNKVSYSKIAWVQLVQNPLWAITVNLKSSLFCLIVLPNCQWLNINNNIMLVSRCKSPYAKTDCMTSMFRYCLGFHYQKLWSCTFSIQYVNLGLLQGNFLQSIWHLKYNNCRRSKWTFLHVVQVNTLRRYFLSIIMLYIKVQAGFYCKLALLLYSNFLHCLTTAGLKFSNKKWCKPFPYT